MWSKKGQKHIAQGSALGGYQLCSHALQGQQSPLPVVLLPLQGVIFVCLYTQGAVLGYMLLPFQGVFLLAEYELNNIGSGDLSKMTSRRFKPPPRTSPLPSPKGRET